MTQMALPFPVTDCWDLIDRAPLQVTCKVSVSLQLQMLREIASYLLRGNQCFASDEHFAAKFRVSIAQIKNTYRALREQGVVHFVEQPRAGMRGRGSRAKLKVIDWGQLSLMVQRAEHCDQRLTSTRPTANQHADQRLTSTRPTANQHADQRLMVSPNYSDNTKEQQPTEQPVVVVDELSFEEVATRLREQFLVFRATEAIDAAKGRGWSLEKCLQLADYAEQLTNKPDPGTVYNWYFRPDSAPREAFQPHKPKPRPKPTLDPWAHQAERLKNRNDSRGKPTASEMLRSLQMQDLKTPELIDRQELCTITPSQHG